MAMAEVARLPDEQPPEAEVPTGLELLARAAARAAPVALAREQSFPVVPALAAVLPEGLRRGSVAVVEGGVGATTLALALAVGASSEGSWVAIAGAPSVGLAAAVELGIAAERLLVVPSPSSGAGTTSATVLAALLDAVDIVVVGDRLAQADARRLQSRARERGSVLLGLPGRWPLAPDVALAVRTPVWESPVGRLAARRVEVVAGGRGRATRERRTTLWLPGPDGKVAPG